MTFLHADTAEAIVESVARGLGADYKVRVVTVWPKLKGFVIEANEPRATALAADPAVDFVEEDFQLLAPLSAPTTVYTNVDLDANGIYNDLWYLDRLDDTTGLDGTYQMCNAALGTAYVLDQAVWRGHQAFNGRSVRTINCARDGVCFEEDIAASCASSNPEVWPSMTHGTAVASVLGGNANGAARPQIVSVNTWRCPGQYEHPRLIASDLINGINWIITDVDSRRNAGYWGPSIVNHSGFAFPWDPNSGSLMNAVRDLAGRDVPYFTSADNFRGDSCSFTPNQYTYTRLNKHWTRVVFTVGGAMLSGSTDQTWEGAWPPGASYEAINGKATNVGDCVSAFAPADRIIVALNGPGQGTYGYMGNGGGTSFASPLAAAVALQWMVRQANVPGRTATYDYLLDSGTSSVTPVFSNDEGAGATSTSAWTPAYVLCYDPNDANQWRYQPDEGIAENGGCPANMLPYSMPSVTNSSDARLIYSDPAHCP